MNTLVVLLFALAVAAAKPLTDEQKEEMKKIHDVCASATGVDEDDISNMYEGELSNEPKIKEHMACFLKNMDIMKDGQIQIGPLEEKLAMYLEDKDKAKEIASKCAVEEDSSSETAFALVTCIHHEKGEK